MTLRDRLAGLITREGPLPIDRYMSLCLHDPADGYYATRPAIGEAGDFITAPMVSQMFGELLGLWAAEVWAAMGRPRRVRLAELGPGHGAMMGDVLRAAGRVAGFTDAREVWLVETSGPLRARQAATLRAVGGIRWAARLEEIPVDAPLILLANEFLDCLPARQAARVEGGWRERRVGLGPDGTLAFVLAGPAAPQDDHGPAAPGAVREWSDELVRFGRDVGVLTARTGGVALFVDYGRDRPGLGDTLQALRAHRKEPPLANPGEADLTVHVDFPAFLAAARRAGAATTPIRTQGGFLRALGIETRAAALARARPDRAGAIHRQLERLIGADEMGELFKVAAVLAPGLKVPGFEAAG